MIRKKQPRNASEYLILNLAFTDLMTCAVGIPLDVAVILFQRWPFGAFMCKVVWPFQTVLIAVSVGTLTCMAIERYRAIFCCSCSTLPGGGGGHLGIYGWICAARDSKLHPVLKKISPKIDTPF